MRWLWAIGIGLFLAVLFWSLQAKDPYFWYSAPNLFGKAQEALEQREPARALELARRALQRQPGNHEYGTFVGWRYLDLGRPQAARDLFQDIHRRQPGAADAVKGLALAEEQLGNAAAALSLLDAYLQVHLEDRNVLQFAASLAGRHRDSRHQALSYWRRLQQLDPRDQESRRQLLDLLISMGQYDEAIPLQEAEVTDFPDNPEVLHQLALLHYWQRDYQAAVPIYQRLLELQTDNLALRREAAKVAEAAQDVDQALAHYLRLYAAEGGKKDYALPLARLWSQKGRHSEAAAVLAPLLADQPSLDLRRAYALELLLSPDFSGALKAYTAAWEAGDTHKETIVNLARLRAHRRHFEVAARFWDELRRRQLLDAPLRWEAALTYSYAHRYPEAVEVMARADRQDPRTLLFLAQMHIYQKHWGQAAHYFRQYLAKHPDDTEVRQELARILALNDETRPEAARQYAQVLERRDDPRVRLQRATLLLQQAQDAAEEGDPAERRRLPDHYAQAEAELRACPPDTLDPDALREAARLWLWLGDLEAARAAYERYLTRAEAAGRPSSALDQARLELARVLIYLQQCPQAQELLRGLRARHPGAWGSPRSLSRPEIRDLLTAAIEADLTSQDWPGAQRWALWLFSSQFLGQSQVPDSWTTVLVWDRQGPHEAGPDFVPLTAEERLWVARALCHHPELSQNRELSRLTLNLALRNVQSRGPEKATPRQYQASLMVLAYLLPRLTHYEDLHGLVYRLPGIQVDSPEYVAALSHFTGRLGRQGGKLDYLLHVLREKQRHRRVRIPGDHLHLAALATELGDQRTAAQHLSQAQKLRPHDQRLTALKLQTLTSLQDMGAVLKTLEAGPQTPEKALQMARMYLQRHQFEGAIAILGDIPPDSPVAADALLLRAQAYRGQGDADQALATLQSLEAQGPPPPGARMLTAQLYEDKEDRGRAQAAYEAVIRTAPDSLEGQVAKARLARSRGQWSRAQRLFTAALQQAPQDIELLNELEQVRAQLRPRLAARSLPGRRGERNPDEVHRPWQFGRYDREPLVSGGSRTYGHALLPLDLPYALTPETTLFRDRNHIKGLDARLGASFWLHKVVPLHLAVDYKYYRQDQGLRLQNLVQPGLTVLTAEKVTSRLQRLGVTLGAGPLQITDDLQAGAELSWRHYWKHDRLKQQTLTTRQFTQLVPLPPPPHFELVTESTLGRSSIDRKQEYDRLFGSLGLTWQAGAATDLSLTYSRKDLFDQDANIYPRLYQSVQDLEKARITGIHQLEVGHSHQIRPGLDWRGSLAGALFSDDNRRVTVYQGLRWRAVDQPRMHLDLTPNYYLAAYRQTQEAYFSPHSYHALGLTLDFDRQLFRLPTLVLQGTAQLVGNQGDWGPALQGLAGLEQEVMQNLYCGIHVFYFREWVDNYRLLSFTGGLRWHF